MKPENDIKLPVPLKSHIQGKENDEETESPTKQEVEKKHPAEDITHGDEGVDDADLEP